MKFDENNKLIENSLEQSEIEVVEPDKEDCKLVG